MELSYGEPQQVIAIAFVGIALLLAGVFFVVALRSRGELPFERVRAVGYRIRRPWLIAISTLLVAGIVVSLSLLPYPSSAQTRAQVAVTGGQFYWSMAPPVVPAGDTVRFDVTSADVNHGFGVYSPSGELVGQVQAMPGYTNHLEIELDETGTYLVSCLEYCGIKHHEMTREFEVVAGG